ncbi:signal recognition particle subunit SRP68 [Temnothorax curvispinosus]|uniref:Signal recognition particle subunit SRP68 n=4 Tax=Temnothorax TaxID=300110 RepID=A0A6J1Q9W3_9HYME|nr:signal recognition particle subunit SRP68 [Temnothorax curvispinosus]TGZ33038.1 Signal recognition particle subunit SRP68 [Temnothorax longispinosus]
MVVEEKVDLSKENQTQNGVTAKEPRTYSLEILKIIKEAQQQHGLRHGDYQRYRGYCSRRLRRLRKVLKVPQGDRRHFKRRDVTATMVSEDKFLQVPLMMAERAWSHAMQLRQESNTEPRKKFHLISRLKKAAAYSLQLQDLIENINCDARTKLEAQAYVAWMNGSLQFELQLWKQAMENLKKAQVVYGNLASALPELEQIVYKARVEELAPSLRYCAYNIGDTSAMDDLMQMRGQLSGELMASLDSLIAQTREKQANIEEVTWRGKSCGTVPPRAAGLIIADSRLNQALERAATNQAKIDLLEAHLIDCKDALLAVRDHFKNELKKENDKWSPQQHLINYLQYIRLSRTLERNLTLVKAAEESDKAKPQDIVRLYEAALHNLVEISQLQDDPEFLEEQEAKTKCYRAFRCFYMAQSLANLHRWREAMALYQRSLQHVKDALKYNAILPAALKEALCNLETSVEAAQYAAHAHSVLEDGQEEESGTSKLAKSKKPLYERLHEYREDPALLTKQPNVYKLPPPMRSIPCKPLFFDLAFNMVEFPDLSHKMGDQAKRGQAGLTGFVKGLWGWGNK